MKRYFAWNKSALWSSLPVRPTPMLAQALYRETSYHRPEYLGHVSEGFTAAMDFAGAFQRLPGPAAEERGRIKKQ